MDIIEIARTTTSLEEFRRAIAERDDKIKRALQKFNGTLSIWEIHEGIKVCYHNATSLCADAKLLFDHERWPRAFAVSITALEEIGKVVVLHSMVEIPKSEPKVWKQHWQNARRHEFKILFGITRIWNDKLYAQMGAHLCSTNDLDGKLIERLRQGGFYVDFDQDDKEWRIPKQIPKAMAEEQFSNAMKSLSELKYYYQRGLFNVKWLERRAQICRAIYDKYDELPASGADRRKFFHELHKLRERFFKELVNNGVLDNFISAE